MSEFIQVVTPECVVCHRTSVLHLPAEGYHRWVGGALIQVALPELTPDERESLMTGSHPECFDSMFPDEEGD